MIQTQRSVEWEGGWFGYCLTGSARSRLESGHLDVLRGENLLGDVPAEAVVAPHRQRQRLLVPVADEGEFRGHDAGAAGRE